MKHKKIIFEEYLGLFVYIMKMDEDHGSKLQNSKKAWQIYSTWLVLHSNYFEVKLCFKITAFKSFKNGICYSFQHF